MASFVILLTARTARIACSDIQTDRQTRRTTTVTLAANARRGLITGLKISIMGATLTMKHVHEDYVMALVPLLMLFIELFLLCF